MDKNCEEQREPDERRRQVSDAGRTLAAHLIVWSLDRMVETYEASQEQMRDERQPPEESPPKLPGK